LETTDGEKLIGYLESAKKVVCHTCAWGERGDLPLLRVQKNVTGQRFLED